MKRLAILRFVLTCGLLTAGAGSARPQAHGPLDVAVPAYPLEASACAALAAGGKSFTVIHPSSIARIRPTEKTHFTGYVYPDTPIFRFYADHLQQLYLGLHGFAPALRCGRGGRGTADGVRFDNLPDGKFIFLIRAEDDTQFSLDVTESGPIVDTLGQLIIYPTHTETQRYYDLRVFMGLATVKQGTISGSPFVQVLGKFGEVVQ